MSSIPEQVAREHLHWPAFGKCRCGATVQSDGCGCNGGDPFIEHIATVTERLTREQVAAEIAAGHRPVDRGRVEYCCDLCCDPEDECVAYLDCPYMDAARIAEATS